MKECRARIHVLLWFWGNYHLLDHRGFRGPIFFLCAFSSALSHTFFCAPCKLSSHRSRSHTGPGGLGSVARSVPDRRGQLDDVIKIALFLRISPFCSLSFADEKLVGDRQDLGLGKGNMNEWFTFSSPSAMHARWPFRLFPRCCWHQNISCILV